ncbi:MAG TPA: ATP-binding cassette domain-containing protein [Spirochaetia bacterium]|nr:ATP-binding cassette domain-containing protein [Spirochaetia bacterium]
MADPAPLPRRPLRLLGAAGVLLLFVIWAGASLAAGSFFVPPPWLTLADTVRLLCQPGTWDQILVTFLRVAVGFLAGFTAGVVAGIGMGAEPRTRAVLRPLVTFFQGMPPLLWAIPLVALMGIGHLPSIIVITLITFPLVAVTVAEGMSTLPRDLGEMLAVFAPGLRARLRELVLPHLAPFLTAAINAGLVLAVKASVTAEYFGANDGIGFQIQSAYMSLRIRSLFSWAAVLILLILLVTSLLPRAVRLVQGLARVARERPSISGEPAAPVTESELRELSPGSRALSLEKVSFSFRRRQVVLKDASLSVRPGEIALLTGESGIGKTTMLRLAAGLLRPSSGAVARPRRLGFVFQDDRLLPWRTVTENAALPLVYEGVPRHRAMAFASRLLAEAGLGGDGGKRPEELSGGMKKRAALARCFARMPDAILMDEPFSGLHAKARAQLWEMFLRLHARHPVPALIVTHYPEELAPGGRVYVLEGRPARLRSAARGRRSLTGRPRSPTLSGRKTYGTRH